MSPKRVLLSKRFNAVSPYAHAKHFHGIELRKAASRSDALLERTAFRRRKRSNPINGGLIDGQNVSRSQNAEIASFGLGSRCACTVAVHRHAEQHIDIGNAALKVIRHCLPGISHAFEKCRAAFPALMNLSLSLASGSAADGNVFERSAEARHAL